MNKAIFLITAILLAIFTSLAEAQTGTRSWSWHLTWTDNSTNEEGFFIYKNGAKAGQVGANVTAFDDAFTASWGEQDCYTVSAFNHANADGSGNIQESAQTSPVCGTVPVPTQPAPAAPSNPSLTPGPTSMLFKWQNNDTAGLADHNEIQRAQATPPRTEYFLVPAAAASYHDVGLKKNTRFTYRVRAEGIAAVSGWTSPVTATTPK